MREEEGTVVVLKPDVNFVPLKCQDPKLLLNSDLIFGLY